VNLIPLELLFGNPTRITPQISPDGSKLAYLAIDDGVLNIHVQTIGRDDDRRMTHVLERGIIYFFWAADSRHLLYLLDHQGDENWRLYVLDELTSTSRDLTPFANVGVQVIGISRRHPDQLLIALNHRDPGVQDVYRLTLATGSIDLVVENPGLFCGWLADGDLVVRAALSPQPDGSFDVMIREHEEHTAWRRLLSWDQEDILSSGPVGLSSDGQSIYLIDSRGAAASRLVSVELKTGKIAVLAGDPEFDINRVVLHPETQRVQAVSFLRARHDWQVLDAGLQEDYQVLSALADGDFEVISRDQEDANWIVCYESDVQPIAFFLYRRSTRTAEFLFHHQPGLLDYALSPVRPISLRARDGLKLSGYLTMPVEFTGKPAPLVVKVHGGPWVRDTWGFDPEVQWLANRGFACLQINFRGSTGYGKGFVNAGRGEWGGKMVDDLVDGVRWAMAAGFADPQRIAIYGVSYGGYTALVAAAQYPEMFSCAIDLAGPTDLVEFLDDLPPQWTPYREIFYQRVGNPQKDADRLRARSPIQMANRLRVPVMIVHGVNDIRVNKAHSDRLVEALRRETTIALEYHEYQDEGHSIGNADNRFQFYLDAERFLQRHLVESTD
jgi:dipeptidyl aminopeptidase/acylaminoacyl peptidase